MKKTFLLLALFSLFSCKQKEKTPDNIPIITEIKTANKPSGAISTPPHNKNAINLNSSNYKGSDITMLLYKNIIEYYGCGEHSVIGKALGTHHAAEVFVVENFCGDFPFKDLISVENGKIVDRITIEENFFDVEKAEIQNIQEETDTTFHIRDLSNIEITTTHLIGEQKISTTTQSYWLDEKGKFQKRK